MDHPSGVLACGLDLPLVVGESYHAATARCSAAAAAEDHLTGRRPGACADHAATATHRLDQIGRRVLTGGGDQAVLVVEQHGASIAGASVSPQRDGPVGIGHATAATAHALGNHTDGVVAAGGDLP